MLIIDNYEHNLVTEKQQQQSQNYNEVPPHTSQNGHC